MEESGRNRNNKGFSLVELIVVIAIMSILAMVISIAVIHYMEKARQAKDVYHASLIKDALNVYPFASDFQGRDVWYEDPVTHEKEHFRRGWVYVDKDEVRCSDASCALAMIYAGLVHVSPEMEATLAENEESNPAWFPTGPDGDYIRKSDINEYVFKNDITVHARRTWNTYQLDVYVDDQGELHLGASASNAQRVGGHEKDEKTARLMAQKLGFYDAKITPIGEQYTGKK